MSYKEIVVSLDELEKVLNYLDRNIPENAIIFLNGNLASGKTTLTKAIAKYKGLDSSVTSPTFSLQHIYGNRLFHYDLYRIDDINFMALGLFEEFEKSGWHIVEWGSKALRDLCFKAGYNVVSIDIEILENKRRYKIEI
jgi:tRNA threonylcarbamoyladenosine biosynthesis protein TsaE